MNFRFNSVLINRLVQCFAVALGAMGMLSTITAAHANRLNLEAYNTVKTVAKIKKDQDIQQALQQVLGKHYQQFTQNFEDYHAPYMLANDKALYIEGEKKDHSAASAATIYQDGTVYVGIYQRKNKTTTFFGNDTLCAASSHPTMIKFGKNVQSVHKIEAINGKSWCATSAPDVTDSSITAKYKATTPAPKSEPTSVSAQKLSSSQKQLSSQKQPTIKQTTTQPDSPPAAKPQVKNSTSKDDQRLASRYATQQQDGKITSRIAEQIQ